MTVAVGAEARQPPARTVDVSPSGVLLVLDEPIILVPGQAVCLAVDDARGRLTVVARLARAARGIDRRTYVAVRIDGELDAVAARRWAGWVDRLGDTDGDAPTGHDPDEHVPDEQGTNEQRTHEPGTNQRGADDPARV